MEIARSVAESVIFYAWERDQTRSFGMKYAWEAFHKHGIELNPLLLIYNCCASAISTFLPIFSWILTCQASSVSRGKAVKV